jgi:hypothetical protein
MRARVWIALVVSACGSDEPIAASRPPAPEAGASDAASPDAAAPPPRRTLVTRSPFGNVAAKGNLLWDGDFEWHSPLVSEYGWLDAAAGEGLAGFSAIRVGPQCKSGIKCGVLAAGGRMIAVGVSPSEAKVRASVWTRPPGGDCTAVSVMLVACGRPLDPDLPLSDQDGRADESGWCEHVAVGEPRRRASCLSLEGAFSAGEALVDDAVIARAPPGSIPTPPTRGSPQAEAARDALRAWQRPGARGEVEARRAFERWRRRAR